MYKAAQSMFLVVFLCAVGSTAEAEEPENASKKPAWQLTIDERLEARFDIDKMAERREAAEARALEQGLPLPNPTRDLVIGSINPEVYMPWEIMNHLLDLGFEPHQEFRAMYRAEIDERLHELGFEADLWSTLEVAAAQYLRQYQLQNTMMAGLEDAAKRDEIVAKIKEVQHPMCAFRAAALEAAREMIGRETFDRILYQVVAPEMELSFSYELGYSEHERVLRFVEGGCR